MCEALELHLHLAITVHCGRKSVPLERTRSVMHSRKSFAIFCRMVDCTPVPVGKRAELPGSMCWTGLVKLGSKWTTKYYGLL